MNALIAIIVIGVVAAVVFVVRRAIADNAETSSAPAPTPGTVESPPPVTPKLPLQ